MTICDNFHIIFIVAELVVIKVKLFYELVRKMGQSGSANLQHYSEEELLR